MRLKDLLTIYDYNNWANTRILEAAAGVTDAEFVADRSFSHGGIRGTLCHVLGAERSWRSRLHTGRPPQEPVTPESFPTLAALKERWAAEEQALRGYIAWLADSDLDRTVSYRNLQGEQQSAVLWEALYHVVNHGTQHRGEVAAMLTDLGHSPGDIDYSVWMRQRK